MFVDQSPLSLEAQALQLDAVLAILKLWQACAVGNATKGEALERAMAYTMAAGPIGEGADLEFLIKLIALAGPEGAQFFRNVDKLWRGLVSTEPTALH